MKKFIIAAPLALLLGSVAIAQTSNDTSTGPATGDGGMDSSSYGNNWSQSIGSTFFSDPERTTMRTSEEITSGWQSLSQEDRDLVIAECERYTTESAAIGADGSNLNTSGTDDTSSGESATTEGATDSASAEGGADTGDTTGPATGDSVVAGDSVSTAVGYDMNAMGSICPTVQGL
jgi:predicted Fe-S protein YdhL (DUF1289 family)